MKFRTTYILFFLIAVGLGFLVWQVVSGGKSGGDRDDWVFWDEHPKNVAIKNEDLKDVDKVQIEREGQPTLVFERQDKGWKMTEPYSLRVTPFPIDNLVVNILNAKKEKADTKEPGLYGLDDPKSKVIISRGDKTWTLNLGEKTASKDSPEIYVTTGEHPKDVARIKYSTVSTAFQSVNEFRDTELLGASESNVEAVDLEPGTDADLKKSNARQVSIARDSKTAHWSYKQPDFGLADNEGKQGPAAPPTKDIDSVNKLLRDLADLRVADQRDFVAEGVSSAELKDKYGLKSPETMRIEVTRWKKDSQAKGSDRETEKVGILIGKKSLEPKPPEKKDEAADKKKDDKKPQMQGYYAALESEPDNVVWLAEDKIKPIIALLSKPEAMRDKNLVLIDRNKVDAIRVKVPDSPEFTLLEGKPEKDGRAWRLERYAGTSKKASAESIKALLDKLYAPRQVNGFPESDKDAGLDKPIAEIWLWENGVETKSTAKGSGSGSGSASSSGSGSASGSSSGSGSGSAAASSSGSGSASASAGKDITEQHLELKKAEEPDVKLIFGSTKDNNLYVRRIENKRTTLLTVPATLADAVKSGLVSYLDASIPSFVEDQAAKIKITRGKDPKDIFELVKEKSGDKTTWKFKSPKEYEGHEVNEPAVRAILMNLAKPYNVSLADETSKDLAKYGLDSPRVKAVVSVPIKADKDGKTDDYIYSIGKEVQNKGVYFMTNKRDGVFLVARDMENVLQQELLDHIARLDVDKVKSIKLSGWKKLGTVITLEAQRKGARDYEAKSAGTTFDGAKLDDFLTKNFVPLRASKILLAGGPKPDDPMFSTAKDALEMEIALKDDMKPLKLTVGGPYEKDGLKGYHAICSAMPGVVFVVPEEPWKSAMEKPAYFTK